MFAYQFIREGPWWDDGEKQEAIKNNDHYHNYAVLIQAAKLANLNDKRK